MRDKALWQGLFLFQNVPGEALEGLALPPPATYRRGQLIYSPENYRRALGVMLRGRAEAVARQRAELNTFQRGDVFGAAALFGGDAYVSSVRAVSECRVQFLPEETLRRLFADYPQTAVNYIAFLSSRVRFLNEKIATYTADSVEGRLYEWCRRNCDREGRLPTDVSMTQLAHILHIGRTSLYRGLDGLAEKNLIKREEGRVIVL